MPEYRSRVRRLPRVKVVSVDEWALVPYPDPPAAVLEAICRQHSLPRPSGRLASNGAINSIWILGDQLVLRIPKNMDEGWKDTLTESVAAPVAYGSGMRTPELIVFDESLELVEVPFTVYQRVHGEPGGPSAPGGWRELGREVALLHDRVVECNDPSGRLDDVSRWRDADSMVRYAADRAKLQGSLRAALETELRRLQPAVDDAQRFDRFLHNDLHPGNLLAQDAEHVAVIDWGDAGWGDPAKEASNLPPEVVDDFLSGYREVMPFDGDDSVEDRLRWDRIVDAIAGGGKTDLILLGEILQFD
jgi:aminoglycoside phosphotransferase (APT) family kinase protein